MTSSPPPPYENRAFAITEDTAIQRSLQTIPKSPISNNPQNETNFISKNQHLKELTDRQNKLHKCVTNHQHRHNPHQKRKNPADSFEQHQNYLFDSMSSSKRFFDHITIEPFAFLAILALYIEFPAIQDLIYTKVCLQVISNHSNSSYRVARFDGSTSANRNPLDGSTVVYAYETIDFPSINQRLSENGRIQQGSQSINNMSKINIDYHDNSLKAHLICDRTNKSAISEEVKHVILEYDSLFWLKYQVLICLLCAISGPYWGGISDKIGRFIPMNVPIVAAIITNLISLIFGILISLDSHNLFEIEWLYAGGIVTGLFGGQAIVIVSSFSYLSDITSNESRSKRVLILESVIYLSHSIGFYLNKLIMSLGLKSAIVEPLKNRHFVAFFVCVCLNMICLIYSMAKLRHQKLHRFMNNFEREQQEISGQANILSNSSSSSLNSRFDFVPSTSRSTGKNVQPTERPRELTASTPDDLDGPIAKTDKYWSDWSAFITLKYYKETYETATKARELRSLILLTLLSGFISAACLTALLSLLFIYLRMDPFNWNTSQYSQWNSLTSITRGVALVGLTLCMKFVSSWKIPDTFIASVGFLSKGIGLLMIALAQSSEIINWALLPLIFSEFSMPPIRSLLSKMVSKDELGKIYSCMASIQNICFLIGNLSLYLVFRSLSDLQVFRISFVVVAGMQFLAVFLMVVIGMTLRKKMLVF